MQFRQKKIKGRHFMGQSSTVSDFSVTIQFLIFKTFFAQSFKKYLKNMELLWTQKKEPMMNLENAKNVSCFARDITK